MATRRILIADDDDLIRRLVVRVLERAGFEALEAVDADEALERFRGADPPPCAALLDLRLPPAGAQPLLEVLRAEAPALRVVVASGAPPDAEQRAQLERTHTPFLAKPFDVRVLLDLVTPPD